MYLFILVPYTTVNKRSILVLDDILQYKRLTKTSERPQTACGTTKKKKHSKMIKDMKVVNDSSLQTAKKKKVKNEAIHFAAVLTFMQMFGFIFSVCRLLLGSKE